MDIVKKVLLQTVRPKSCITFFSWAITGTVSLSHNYLMCTIPAVYKKKQVRIALREPLLFSNNKQYLTVLTHILKISQQRIS
jgi:hypothetical protein